MAAATLTAEINEEMTGTLEQADELLIFAAGSLDASDDATARATAATALEYLDVMERRIAELRANIAERLADCGARSALDALGAAMEDH